MDIMIDLRDLAWKDKETSDIVRIVNFSTADDIDIVWYMDVESLEEHCMDIDTFVSKHIAQGLFDDFESV